MMEMANLIQAEVVARLAADFPGLNMRDAVAIVRDGTWSRYGTRTILTLDATRLPNDRGLVEFRYEWDCRASPERGRERMRLVIALKPGFGRKPCPICGARAFQRCRDLSYGRKVAYRETRHYERYVTERGVASAERVQTQ